MDTEEEDSSSDCTALITPRWLFRLTPSVDSPTLLRCVDASRTPRGLLPPSWLAGASPPPPPPLELNCTPWARRLAAGENEAGVEPDDESDKEEAADCEGDRAIGETRDVRLRRSVRSPPAPMLSAAVTVELELELELEKSADASEAMSSATSLVEWNLIVCWSDRP
jgi:hypothetical protein